MLETIRHFDTRWTANAMSGLFERKTLFSHQCWAVSNAIFLFRFATNLKSFTVNQTSSYVRSALTNTNSEFCSRYSNYIYFLSESALWSFLFSIYS